MSASNDMSGYNRSGSDSVSVAPGVPTDRVRWGPILAGTFAAFTALAVLSTLGAAIGLSAYDQGDNPRNYAIGAGVWGVITMLLAFGFGGWFAARSAAVRGTHNGLMNGFMVAGLGIPLLLFMLGSAGGLLGHAMASNRDAGNSMSSGGNAQQASATIGGSGSGSDGVSARLNTGGSNNNANVSTEDARRASSRTAWGTLISFVLAIGAASIAGLMGARDDRRHYSSTGTSGTGGTTGTSGSTGTTGGGASSF